MPHAVPSFVIGLIALLALLFSEREIAKLRRWVLRAAAVLRAIGHRRRLHVVQSLCGVCI
jgi:hypothetical protein